MNDNDRIMDGFFRQQWDTAESGVSRHVSSRMKKSIDRSLASERRPRAFRTALAYAFGSLGLAAAIVLGVILHNVLQPADAFSTVTTEKGQKVSMVLADGTKIWLNSDSELSFPSFDKASSRDVYLKGECYFEVAKDDRKPFIVHTGIYDVTAVGTAFNVHSYCSDDIVKTTLYEGKVLVSGPGISTGLMPDEAIAYSRASGKYTKTLSEQSYYDALWRGNELVVKPGTTLEQLTDILERNYNIQFGFADEKVKHHTFEGVIRDCQIANVLDLICLSAPVSYRMEDGMVVFYAKKQYNY